MQATSGLSLSKIDFLLVMLKSHSVAMPYLKLLMTDKYLLKYSSINYNRGHF